MNDGDGASRGKRAERVRWPGVIALLGAIGACESAGESTSTAGPGGAGGVGGGGGSGAAAGQGGAGGATSTRSTAQGGAGGGGQGGGAEGICPSGSGGLALDLAGKTASLVAGVPPADGYSAGFGILEGPVWLDGALLLSEISTSGQPPAARILRLVPGSSPEVLFGAAGANGLAVNAAGELFAARHADGSISRLDPASPGAAPVVVAGSYLGDRFNSPNDLAIRGDGNIYFTDPDWQSPKPNPQAAERAYRIAPNGEVTAFGEYEESGVTSTVQKPNGVALRLDESAIFVGGTGGLFEMPIAEDGSVGKGARVSSVSGGVDGLGKDCAGNLYVTNGQSVVVLGADDVVIGSIAVGAQVTNVAFGGPERKTLYITSLGSEPRLYEVALNVPGYPY